MSIINKIFNDQLDEYEMMILHFYHKTTELNHCLLLICHHFEKIRILKIFNFMIQQMTFYAQLTVLKPMK